MFIINQLMTIRIKEAKKRRIKRFHNYSFFQKKMIFFRKEVCDGETMVKMMTIVQQEITGLNPKIELIDVKEIKQPIKSPQK